MTKWGSLRRATDALAAGGLALVLMLGGCSAPETAADRDIQPTAKRIVTLNPCTDAMLVEIASADQILALSHYSHDPASSSIPQNVAQRYEVTGGTVEEILALDPDVVLASSFMAPATGQALRDLELPFASFGSPTTVAESLEQLRYAADRVGREQAGRDLAMRIETALSRNRAPPGDEPISTVLWQPGEIVPGEGTLIHALMEQAGFASHSAALGLGQADHLSLEMLLANPPDLLLIAGNSRGQLHPALAKLQDTKVEELDPSLLYCGGPTIIRAMERLGEIRRNMRDTGA